MTFVQNQVCAQRGYNFVCTMAASFSVERRKVRSTAAAVLKDWVNCWEQVLTY
jgi:acyl-CoA thioesterase